MEGSKKYYIDNAAQSSSAGLTIRQKEPKHLEAPFDPILRARNRKPPTMLLNHDSVASPPS
jgi:hypothetical protein